MRLASPLLLAAAAVLIPATAFAQAPQRKEGLWEMTMQMSSPAPMTMTSQQCTDASHEKAGAMFRNSDRMGAAGVDCKAGPTGPAAGGGWSYSSVCTMKNMTMTTSGVAKGDFKSGYHVDSTTRMSPAPMPQMAETHMSIDAKWLGPCPAGMAPGDVVMNGRKISARPHG